MGGAQLGSLHLPEQEGRLELGKVDLSQAWQWVRLVPWALEIVCQWGGAAVLRLYLWNIKKAEWE